MRVVIVGGGVIGCATAYYLAKAGVQAVVLERDGIAGEASGAAAGMLIPPLESVPPGPFRDLCRASLSLYPELVAAVQAESGIDVQYLSPGILLLAQTEARADAMRSYARWHREQGGEAEWVEAGALRSLEPALSPEIVGATYLPGQSHVNPGLLTQALAAAAAAHGAEVRPGAAVTGFACRHWRADGVRTGAGLVAGDAVVLAGGPWTQELAARLGARVPVKPMRGQMIAYQWRGLRHMVWGEDGYLVPKPALSRAGRAGGFVFAGATVEDVGFRRRTTRDGLSGLRRMAASTVPALRRAEVSSAWAGLRPASPDGLPIIGRLPGWENVYVATGHFRNGILLAPVTGRLMTQLICEGRTEVDLRPFRPERFAG